MSPKDLQIVGLLIAIPLAVYALRLNGVWAEPEPTKIKPTIVIRADVPAYTELIEELNIETLTEGEGKEEMGDYGTKPGELDLLAACVEAEAGNQNLLGKRLVVDVILNRWAAPDFPDSIKEVIEEPGQFKVVDSGAIQSVKPTDDTWYAVYAELTGIRASEEVMYFRTGHYSNYGHPWGCIGDHYFSGR